MNYPYVDRIIAKKGFPLTEGDVLRIKNPEGTLDLVKVKQVITGKYEVTALVSTSRLVPGSNKPHIGW